MRERKKERERERERERHVQVPDVRTRGRIEKVCFKEAKPRGKAHPWSSGIYPTVQAGLCF